MNNMELEMIREYPAIVKELAVAKALASKLLEAIEEHKRMVTNGIPATADEKLWEVLK